MPRPRPPRPLVARLLLGLWATSCLSSTACTSSAEIRRLEADPATAELHLIQRADPRAAVEAAWSRGDKRFLGVAGFSIDIPGLDLQQWMALQPDEFRVIVGTGDQMNDQRARLIAGARRYAEEYNLRLLEKLANPPATQRVGK